jgi:NTP pyrophosphatase (non-canonical NTP hydrolase)
MNLKNEFEPIRKWAEEKGIFDKGDLKTQTLKLYEEAGELSKAVLNNDKEEIIDAIGDCIVVLTNVAELASYHFEDNFITVEKCINSAYDIIAKRKGQMINGTFVKNE